MNRVILIGRLSKDVETRETASGMRVARYTLAVDRMKEGADFISCVAFDKNADFALKYLAKGTKICVEGRIQTGSYEKDGRKVYTTDVVVDRHEFCESKKASQDDAVNRFVTVEDISDEELPFS